MFAYQFVTKIWCFEKKEIFQILVKNVKKCRITPYFFCYTRIMTKCCCNYGSWLKTDFQPPSPTHPLTLLPPNPNSQKLISFSMMKVNQNPRFRRSGMSSACTLLSTGHPLFCSCKLRCYSLCFTCRKQFGGCHLAQHFLRGGDW